MKPNAAAVCLEYGICQQVIGIHQHRGQHNTPRLFPVFPEAYMSDYAGQYKMHGIVKELLHAAKIVENENLKVKTLQIILSVEGCFFYFIFILLSFLHFLKTVYD